MAKTSQVHRDLRRKASEEIDRVFRGEVPRNWVNRWERSAGQDPINDHKQENAK